jgi:hypothetical protein
MSTSRVEKARTMGHLPEGKSPHVQHLWPHHRSMVRAAFEGARPGELADAYGMTDGQISRIINSPLFQAELSRLEAEADIALVEARRGLKVLAAKSVEIISKDLESLEDAQTFEEKKLRLRTCFDVLDRAKIIPDIPVVQLHKHEHLHVDKMSDEELFRDVVDLTREG